VVKKMSLNPNQQLFFNALTAKRFMLERDARELHRDLQTQELVANDADADDGGDELPSNFEFDRFWGQISSQLREHFGFEIRRIKFIGGDEKLYIGIANVDQSATHSAAITKLATRLQPKQIALFRVILDEILKTDLTCLQGVDMMTLLNSNGLEFGNNNNNTQQQGDDDDNEEKKEFINNNNNNNNMMQQGGGATQAQVDAAVRMSLLEKEATVAQFCNDGWLYRPRDNVRNLKLGVRCFLELKDFILDQCPESIAKKWENAL
jgi:hypothetical protein